MIKRNIPNGIDGLLLTSDISRRYVTGFDYTDGYLLLTRNKCYLFADSRYIEAARNQIKDNIDIVLLKGSRSGLLSGYFAREGITKLCFEDRAMTCSAFEALKKDFPAIQFEPAGNIIESLREFKDSYELNCITTAQRIAERGFDHILGYINPERTETDIALELEFFMRRNGAKSASFDIIAVSGSASSLPHGVPRRLPLERGFLTLDFGATYNGYRSDMTRTVCIGKADNEMRWVYSVVLEAQLAALDSIKCGASCVEIDKKARDIIKAAGYGDNFGHGLGHGVGLLIHEAPRLSPGAKDTVLSEGHVVTVEPGIYLEGRFGVRIEDMVYVTRHGKDNLTLSPKDLIEL